MISVVRLSRRMLSVAVLALAPALHAQQTPPTPTFEVASVRVSPPGENRQSTLSPYGTPRFSVTNVPLTFLLELAYGVNDYQLAHLPKWADTTLYDISASSEGGVPLSYEDLKPRMQTLLQQRFHLQLHHESQAFKGYALVVAKGGAKLKPSKGDSGTASILPNGLRASNVTMAMLASMLSRSTRRPVADSTGLPGTFDISLDYAPEGAPDSTLPSLFTALQEQLGLKLENQMVPVDMFVIDHVDEVPTAN